ncbi:MAG: TPR end-of-group domain-containing protein [Planctomycetota bacterium]|jgi:tetratricopeptide (TPR) repeat protein
MGSEELNAIEMAGVRFQIGIFEEALSSNPRDTDALRYLAHAYAVVGRAEDGLAADRRLVDLLPRDPRVRYNLACSCALSGRVDEALEVLAAACELGFEDLNLMRKDTDLDSLREDPRYREVESRLARRRKKS